MSRLADFLLARLAEDEESTHAWAEPPPNPWIDDSNRRTQAVRLFKEIEAKRRIVERYATCLAENERNTADHEAFVAAGGSEFDEPDPTLYEPIDRTRTTSAFETAGLAFACQTLATAYADHPEYRDEWRP